MNSLLLKRFFRCSNCHLRSKSCNDLNGRNAEGRTTRKVKPSLNGANPHGQYAPDNNGPSQEGLTKIHGKAPFRNNFRFAIHHDDYHVHPVNATRKHSLPMKLRKKEKSDSHNSLGDHGLHEENSHIRTIVIGGTLFDEETDESKSRVEDFTRRWELKKNELKIKGEIIYGLHSVYLALKNHKRACFKLFMKDSDASAKESERENILKMAYEKNVPIVKTNARMLDIIATGHVHQGVCMDVERRVFSDLLLGHRSNNIHPCSLWLVLDYIQDPMNFGAILRSAFYFGVEKVIVNRDKNCRLSPVVSKASSGVMESMDVHGVSDIPSFLKQQQESGYSVVGTVGVVANNPDSQPYSVKPVKALHSVVNDKPTILVIGNEGRGITKTILELCDMLISIPPVCPHELLDSLNVSVATGILLHHLSNNKKE